MQIKTEKGINPKLSHVYFHDGWIPCLNICTNRFCKDRFFLASVFLANLLDPKQPEGFIDVFAGIWSLFIP
jgi:hypothetical protein